MNTNLSLDRRNCFGISVEADNLAYSRMIDNHVYSITKQVLNDAQIVSTMRILSNLNDDDFKYLSTLQKSVTQLNKE